MGYTIKEVYDDLQEGKKLTVLVSGSVDDIKNTLYANLFIKGEPSFKWIRDDIENKSYRIALGPYFITEASKVYSNTVDWRDDRDVRVMVLASFANMLSIEAEKVNGVSFTYLYARNVSCIKDLIQSNILYVCTNNNGSRFLAVNVVNVKMRQVKMLFSLLGYTLTNKSVTHSYFYTGYALSKAANN